MADLTITAASVIQGSNAVVVHGTAGASITAGDAVYKDSADSEWKLADNNDTDLKSGSNGFGIALHAAEDGQPLSVQTQGNIDLGATLSVGETYIVSANAGKIADIGDATTNTYMTYVGYADAADNLVMAIGHTGVQHA